MFQQGSLWEIVLARSEQAHMGGALRPIPTEYQFFEQDGVDFLVRIIANLARKDASRQATDKDPNDDPYLPYEEALFIADISDTHLCLLNKFNVVDHHLLIVTRNFEHQEMLLTPSDFHALAACLVEFESIGFYNGGETAGASQTHKHLQMVPLPLAPGAVGVPIEALLLDKTAPGHTRSIPALPFAHAFAPIELDRRPSPADIAETLHACYRDMVTSLALEQGTAGQQAAPYNLLVTRRWMLLVPRSEERFAGVSVNALGFAGALLVRDEGQLQAVKEQGAMQVLKSVAVARGSTL